MHRISLLTSEVKQHRARLVLGWGTAWEDLRVLSAFAHFRATNSLNRVTAKHDTAEQLTAERKAQFSIELGTIEPRDK